MSLSRYLTLLGVCAGLCWIGWFVVLMTLNPNQGWSNILFFYLSLGLALVATLAIVGVVIRVYFIPNELPSRQVRVSSRHAVLFTLLILLALILQSARWLTWWNFVILIIVAGLSELFFISYRRLK